MTLVLEESTDCYHLLLSTSLDNNCHFQPISHEFQINDPKGISHGYRYWYHPRPGISLLIDNYKLQEDLVIINSQSQGCAYLELGFNVINNSSNIDYRTGKNFLSLAVDHGERGHHEWKAQERIIKLDIHIEYSLFKNLITPHLDRLPPGLRNILETKDSEIDYWQIGRTTAPMQTILKQILNCPYQALTKQLYLEAKVLELMALRLEDLNDSSPLDRNVNLKPIQIDSIYQARDILINNFKNPPTLIALAHQVNLNDCTLKKGFQQIFGTTVFGYLHNYRMERAKELLLDEKLTVKQVAQYVGYASRSAFMTAFCKKFGVSPSVYSRKNSV